MKLLLHVHEQENVLKELQAHVCCKAHIFQITFSGELVLTHACNVKM